MGKSAKRWQRGMVGALVVVVGFCVNADAVDITINDTGSFSQPYDGTRPGGARYVLTSADLGGFSTVDADKLVVVFSWEDDSSIEEVSYGSNSMTQIEWVTVVVRNVAMYYLDAPPATGDLVVDLSTSNGLGLSALALSNTSEGYIAPSSSATATSTSITTTNDNALVIAAGVNNGGSCSPIAPLNLIFSGDGGSCGHGSAYQYVPSSGTTITPTFSSAEAVIAVEFPPAPPAGTVIVIK